MKRLKVAWLLSKRTFQSFQSDKVPRLAAALAYYTLFSLAPLLVIAIAIARPFLAQEQLQSRIRFLAQQYVGYQGLNVVNSILENMSQPGIGTLAGAVSIVILLFGASNVFAQLKDALNTIMNVAPNPDVGIMSFIRNRLIALVMVFLVGLLLLVIVAVTTTINLTVTSDNPLLNLPGGTQIWRLFNTLTAWFMYTFAFAALYKLVPDVKLAWSDALIGAGVGALLFIVGQWLLAIYLSGPGTRTLYGAAGSTIAILLWLYVSAQILFIGAEFTQVFAKYLGGGLEPNENAVTVIEVRRDQLETRAPETLPDVEL